MLVLTITDKEFPVAREVFGQYEPLAEVESTGAYTLKSCTDAEYIPLVLVQAGLRANLSAADSVTHWVGQFRPQVILVVGTAGGICRPTNAQPPYEWAGPKRGDVVFSEFVHYAQFIKVTAPKIQMRYQPLEQPSMELSRDAWAVQQETDWHDLLGSRWDGATRFPAARRVEILSGDAVQDDPLDPMQQFLMGFFDRAGATEMESAGVASRLHAQRMVVHYAPLFLTIRGISDLIWARGPHAELTEEDVRAARALDAAATAGAGTLSEPAIVDKTAERDQWSPRAAASASAFAFALTARIVSKAQATQPGHPAIPPCILRHAPTGGLSEHPDSVKP